MGDLLGEILSSKLPALPKQVPLNLPTLNLPKLKKVDTKPELKLPKLKKL